jgi:hypothetical protein
MCKRFEGVFELCRVRRVEWGFGVEGDLPAVGCVGEKDGESDGWDHQDGDRGDVDSLVAWVVADEWMSG